jgi:1,4-dihydroxy-2-naphthoate octaprenyltransferase
MRESGLTLHASSVSRRDVWVHMLLYPRHTLPTAAAPVIVASGLAWRDGVFVARAAVAAFLAGWLIQLGGVIADNYHNLSRHADDREHAAFVAALRAGIVTLAELRAAIAACYVLAALPGAYLVYVSGFPALAVGIASILASLAYSANPYPLGDHGLGDPLFFVFFGVVSVVASYYVQAAATVSAPLTLGIPAGTLPWTAVAVSVPVAALATNILVIDNIRDLDYDRAKNERTIAVLIGPGWSRVEYVLLLILAYAVPMVLWLAGGFTARVLLPLASLPYAVIVAGRVIRTTRHDAMVPLTPQAAQLLLAYSLLFAAGLVR